MQTDLVFVEPAKDNIKPKLRVALGRSSDSSKYEFEDFSKFITTSSEDPDCLDPHPDAIMSQPHSSSYLDLNGDCLPDIFMNMYREYPDPADNKKMFAENYFDIYVQKIRETIIMGVDGTESSVKKQKYCLKQTN
jgi:hypothetical protein